MRDIKRRLERLEQDAMPDEDRECVVFLCVSFLDGKLVALDGEGITVNRLPDETEKQLYDRASIEVRKAGPDVPISNDDKAIYMLHEVREKIERSEDRWRADPMGTGMPHNPDLTKQDTREADPVVAAPVVKPEPVRGPEPSPAPRPAPREIVEVRREYGPGISHWMMS